MPHRNLAYIGHTTVRSTLIAAVTVAAVALSCVVAVSPAAARTKRPPCTKKAIAAGLGRGAEKMPGGKVEDFRCARRFAVALVDYEGFAVTAVFRAHRARWVSINRTKPCERRSIPKKIYRAACLTN